MRTETEEFLAKQRAFIEAGDWPNFPLLPMKRYRGGGQFPQTAVIYAPESTAPRIVLYLDVSIFNPGAALRTAETATFKSLEELTEAGWRVD